MNIPSVKFLTLQIFISNFHGNVCPQKFPLQNICVIRTLKWLDREIIATQNNLRLRYWAAIVLKWHGVSNNTNKTGEQPVSTSVSSPHAMWLDNSVTQKKKKTNYKTVKIHSKTDTSIATYILTKSKDGVILVSWEKNELLGSVQWNFYLIDKHDKSVLLLYKSSSHLI